MALESLLTTLKEYEPGRLVSYIGILGGIGVGFSAQYGWQAVFNTFGALAIAVETYGLQGAVSLRVIQNVFLHFACQPEGVPRRHRPAKSARPPGKR